MKVSTNDMSAKAFPSGNHRELDNGRLPRRHWIRIWFVSRLFASLRGIFRQYVETEDKRGDDSENVQRQLSLKIDHEVAFSDREAAGRPKGDVGPALPGRTNQLASAITKVMTPI